MKQSDFWDLDITLSKLILPYLVEFKKIHNGHPADTTEEEYEICLDKMIFSFQCIADFHKASADVYEHSEAIQEGLNLFAKYFRHFWI